MWVVNRAPGNASRWRTSMSLMQTDAASSRSAPIFICCTAPSLEEICGAVRSMHHIRGLQGSALQAPVWCHKGRCLFGTAWHNKLLPSHHFVMRVLNPRSVHLLVHLQKLHRCGCHWPWKDQYCLEGLRLSDTGSLNKGCADSCVPSTLLAWN